MKNKKKLLTGLYAAFILCNFVNPELAFGTASTHVWAPSTDTQAFGTGHVTADVYIPTERNGDASRARTITNSGLTFGLLPFKYVHAEAGFDYKTGYGSLDNYPMYFNAKVAIPEGVYKGVFPYAEFFPGVAGGIYDIGTKTDKTNDNIVYVKTAKTFDIKGFSLGRASIGYFWGNDKLLLDQNGEKDADGILACWERTMTEISDRLWIAVEYQGTKSGYGALNLGASWKFTPNISVIAGYQFYNNRNLADTATIQVDIDF